MENSFIATGYEEYIENLITLDVMMFSQREYEKKNTRDDGVVAVLFDNILEMDGNAHKSSFLSHNWWRFFGSRAGHARTHFRLAVRSSDAGRRGRKYVQIKRGAALWPRPSGSHMDGITYPS